MFKRVRDTIFTVTQTEWVGATKEHLHISDLILTHIRDQDRELQVYNSYNLGWPNYEPSFPILLEHVLDKEYI